MYICPKLKPVLAGKIFSISIKTKLWYLVCTFIIHCAILANA